VAKAAEVFLNRWEASQSLGFFTILLSLHTTKWVSQTLVDYVAAFLSSNDGPMAVQARLAIIDINIIFLLLGPYGYVHPLKLEKCVLES
jgi:dolichyl-phosphate-mannose--protein O-mannosyl transferase